MANTSILDIIPASLHERLFKEVELRKELLRQIETLGKEKEQTSDEVDPDIKAFVNKQTNNSKK